MVMFPGEKYELPMEHNIRLSQRQVYVNP